MSFPSEIFRTTTNAANKVAKDLKDPALRNIGIKKIKGLGFNPMVWLGLHHMVWLQKGFHRYIWCITNEDEMQLKQFVQMV